MTRKTAAPDAARPDTGRRTPHAGPRPVPGFTPAPARPRSDGWTPARQVAFVEALAECGCVEEACARVGMSTTSAYQLRRRPDAASFREAWEFALDYAVRRLSDAVFARALHGTATPVFYKGEQIGERRRYDEKLAMFLLRYRDPVRYGAWLDAREVRRHPDGAAQLLNAARARVGQDAAIRARGGTPPTRAPLAGVHHVTDDEQRIAEQEAAEQAARAAEERDRLAKEAEWNRYLQDEAGIARLADRDRTDRDRIEPGEDIDPGEDDAVWLEEWDGNTEPCGRDATVAASGAQAAAGDDAGTDTGADAGTGVCGADVAPTSPTYRISLPRDAAPGDPDQGRSPDPP